jgi:GNAT superfamily N-acetyltransferase
LGKDDRMTHNHRLEAVRAPLLGHPGESPDSGLSIRSRRAEDLPSCVAVLAEVHRSDGYPELWPADAAGWLDPPDTIAAWLAEAAGNKLLGHVSLIPDSTGGMVKLSRLFVAPQARGGGVARPLMDTAVGWAQERDLDVVLEVYEGTPAVAVYEALGWRFLNRGPASWTGLGGRRPMLRHYAAPGKPFAAGDAGE